MPLFVDGGNLKRAAGTALRKFTLRKKSLPQRKIKSVMARNRKVGHSKANSKRKGKPYSMAKVRGKMMEKIKPDFF